MKNNLLLTAMIVLFVYGNGAAQTEQLERMWYTVFPPNYQSKLVDVAVDQQGYIYATGLGYDLINSQSSEDFFTVKLNPVTGDTIWSRTYTRQSEGGSPSNANAKKIAIDDQGNIYVAGGVHLAGKNPPPQTYDFVIIKYRPDGNVIWMTESGSDYILSINALSAGYFDMKMSYLGNIYIGGAGNLLKYDQSGQLIWGINNPFTIRTLAVDSEENVIVTGTGATRKYSSTGTLLWHIPNEGTCNPTPFMGSIIIDEFDDIYVGGYTCVGGNHKVIRKYSKTGQVLWIKNINTGDARDNVVGLLLDNFNHLYAGGRSISFSASNTQFGGDPVRKYTSSGDLLWISESPGSVFDFSGSGSLLTLVTSGENNALEKRTQLKEFNSLNGTLLDTAFFYSTGNSARRSYYSSAIVQDVGGVEQIVTVGLIVPPGQNENARIAVAYSKQEIPMPPGDLLLAGIPPDSIRLNFEDNSIIETGFKVQRSSTNGAVWNDVFILPASNEPYPFRVIKTIHNSVGGSGNLFRVCAFNDNGHSDWIASNGVKWPSAPTELIADYFIGNNSVVLNWKDISRIETGYKVERRIGEDTLFQEIGAVGENATEFVDDNLPAPVMGVEYFYRIRAYTGSVYSDYSDVVVVAVVPVELVSFSADVSDQSVRLSWVTASETNNMGFEVERAPSVSPPKGETLVWERIGFVDGNGTTTETKTYSFQDKNVNKGKYQYRLKQIDFDGTFEYSDVVEVEVDFMPREYVLEQNYPNPFNPGTKISWQSPVGSRQTLKVYDVLGNEVTTLVDEYREAGKYDVEFNSQGLSSGVYFYRLQTEGFTSTRKMVIMK